MAAFMLLVAPTVTKAQYHLETLGAVESAVLGIETGAFAKCLREPPATEGLQRGATGGAWCPGWGAVHRGSSVVEKGRLQTGLDSVAWEAEPV